MPTIDAAATPPTLSKGRTARAGVLALVIGTTLLVASYLVADGVPPAPEASRHHKRARRHQVQAVAESPSPSPPAPPPPIKRYCVYNREDNRIHISMASGVACGEISSKQHDVGCGRRAKVTAPKECGRNNKQDWIFSTYYQQSGQCECLFGSQTSACTLVTAEEAAALENPPPQACLDGYPGDSE